MRRGGSVQKNFFMLGKKENLRKKLSENDFKEKWIFSDQRSSRSRKKNEKSSKNHEKSRKIMENHEKSSKNHGFDQHG